MPGVDPASVWVTFCLEPPLHPWGAARRYLAPVVGPLAREGLALPKIFVASCAVAVCWGYRFALLICVPAQRCVAPCIPRRGCAAAGTELFAACRAGREGQRSTRHPSHWVGSIPALGTDGSCLGKAVKLTAVGLDCGRGDSALQPLDRIHPCLSGSRCQGLARCAQHVGSWHCSQSTSFPL